MTHQHANALTVKSDHSVSTRGILKILKKVYWTHGSR